MDRYSKKIPTVWGKETKNELLEEAKTIQIDLKKQANFKFSKSTFKNTKEDVPFPEYDNQNYF